MSALVIVHSLTHTTKGLADRLADGLHAPVVDIVEHRTRPRSAAGLGIVVGAFEALTGRKAPIEPLSADPETFDPVAIGGPVWAGRPSSPLATALSRYAGALRGRRVGLFCTSKGADPGVFFDRAERLLGRPAEARLHLHAGNLAGAEAERAIARFLEELGPVEPDRPAGSGTGPG
ncbi:MAG: hypothetical protein RID91_12780 [Azospirillaceae bacterium]